MDFISDPVRITILGAGGRDSQAFWMENLSVPYRVEGGGLIRIVKGFQLIQIDG